MPNLSSIVGSVKKEFSKENPDIIFDPNKKVEFIPSGSFAFDLVSGGGFPRGRLTEIFGMEHSGKTSLLYAACAQIQQEGGIAIILDYENAFDPIYAKDTYGLVQDDETFTIFTPDDLEEGDKLFEIIQTLDNIDLIGFDSIEAMKPRIVIECKIEDLRKIPGIQARAIANVVQKVRKFCRQKQCAGVFTNQMRANIQIGPQMDQNIGTGSGYNTKEKYVTPGGMAPRFYASLRMKLEYGGRQTDAAGEDMITGASEKSRIGHEIKVINIKNKVFTPFLKGTAFFDFVRPEQQGGWNEAKEIINILTRRGRISQRGTRFEYTGFEHNWNKVGSKISSIKEFSENPELLEDAKKLIDMLMNTGRKKDILDSATPEDILPEDIEGQEIEPSELKVEFSELEEKDTSKDISLEEVTPESKTEV